MDHNHCITFLVDRSLKPFMQKPKVDETRNIFADHKNKEDLLDERHEHLLVNYQALKGLGPHQLLALQRQNPLRWIDIRIEVKGRPDWVTLTLRDDNLYCNGFSNKKSSYEMLSPSVGDKQPNPQGNMEMLPQLLGQNFQPLQWDLCYRKLFGCETNDEVDLVLQQFAKDPNFVVDAVCFLSKYEHKIVDDEEVENEEAIAEEVEDEEAIAKKYIGGLIFLLIEILRMDMESQFVGIKDGQTKMVTSLQKVQIWGILCEELRKWRDRGFQDWITSDPEKKTNKAVKLRAAGIHSELDGLRLVFLVLNDKSKGSDKGEGSQEKGKGDDNQGDKGSQDKWDGSQHKWDGSQGGDSKAKSSQDRSHGDSSKWKVSQDKGGPPYYGCCRLQLLALTTNFSIDGINIYDWHRGQEIYRRYLVNQEELRGNKKQPLSSASQERLVLIGPGRAISTYGSLGLQIFCSTDGGGRKRKRKTIQRNPPIRRVWSVHSSDDDKPRVYHQDFYGDLPHEKITMSYMVIPDTIEARVEVALILGDYKVRYGLHSRDRGYVVCGTITAHAKEMESWYVELLSPKRNSFRVPRGKKTQIPMVSLVCLPSEVLEISVHLTLKPSVGQREEISQCVRFNPSLKVHRQNFGRHTIEIAVDMRT